MATLQNKTILVVGGSSGIGFGVALAALQSQASVVIIASSNHERVAGAVERLRAHKLPGEVRGEVLDARDAGAVKDFAVRIGAIDHAVWTSGDVPARNAGVDLSTAVFAVRFWGPLTLVQNAKFNEGGSMTLTTGPSDFKPRPRMVVPAGACGSVAGLVKGLAVDLAPLRVNVVSPGTIDTEIWDKFGPGMRDNLLNGTEERQLIKRIGQPRDVAEAYTFLMKCEFITGERINVDGGLALA